MKKIIFVIFILGFLFSTGCSTDKTNVVAPKVTPIAKTITITMADVAKHNAASNCWMIISGKVYDVTNAESTHPGGNKILMGCGKDATNLFEARPHSPKAHDMLINYYLGDLK